MEKDGLSINSMGIFHGYVTNNQRVYHGMMGIYPSKAVDCDATENGLVISQSTNVTENVL